MSDRTFLPSDVQMQIVESLVPALRGVNVATIGEKDFNDDDALVLDLPAVRVRYDSSKYIKVGNTARVYGTEHTLQIWCAAENLSSDEAQRNDTLDLVGKVLVALVGTKLVITQDAKSDPVELRGINPLPDDNIGILYIVTLSVAGTAQFPATPEGAQ